MSEEKEKNKRVKNIRNKFVHLKCTLAEREDMKEKAEAAGTYLSTLIRESLNRVNTWTITDRNAAYEFSKQLSRIGSNLNQIARWANTEKDAVSAISVISALSEIEKEVLKAREDFKNAH